MRIRPITYWRESLYKAFAPGAKPRFDTVMKVLQALGLKLHAEPARYYTSEVNDRKDP